LKISEGEKNLIVDNVVAALRKKGKEGKTLNVITVEGDGEVGKICNQENRPRSDHGKRGGYEMKTCPEPKN